MKAVNLQSAVVRRLLHCYLVFSALLLSVPSFAAQNDQTWKVNLKDADIRAFVSQVADITGYSFVIDPRVKGKVTVISNASMTRNEVYEMFLSVLQVHGFTAIPAEDIIKIVQQNEAKQTADNLKLLRQVPNEQIVTRVIQVNNANALEMVPILRPMVAKYGHLAGVSAANALIISDHISNIRRISKIVEELDSPSKYELEVIQLEEAWVGDLVKLLEQLAPNELGRKGSKARSKKYSVVADERSNRLILRGDENFRSKIKELIGKLDQPAATAGTTKVVKLQHADAKGLAELLKGLMGDVRQETKEKGPGKTKPLPASIYADEGLNALVIRAEPSIMREVELVIAQLDIRRAQVLIEAAIVEVSDEANNGFGIQWALGDQGGAVPGALTNFGNVGVSATDVLTAIATKNLTAPAKGGGSIGFGNIDKGGISWGGLIQALSTNTDTNLLSTPSVITMDNQESRIVVGQNVPFVTGESTNTKDGLSNPFKTISREDVGVKLTVTPSVSEGDTVRLEINQEISSVDDSVESASDIVTNTREISTAVLADDKEIIVLGGLIADDVRSSINKVPLLGDIPYLGELFRSTEVKKSKRNLIVFLRPTILRDKDQSRVVSEQLYDGLWELNLERVADKKVPEYVEKPQLESLFKKNVLTVEE
ncbi:MAG: type II secretion system protein GspD [Proteobacteria bacterium]|nr:MAG: type II secretion system protein GspD [Pseudomonadota bacterium]PIE40223.1 MAG: type II secretion system protein GspD [Gammaproteobacteria bacterium]